MGPDQRPETELRGYAALAKAAEHDDVVSPAELLADDPTSIEESPEARWETEGGHLLPA
jgi:hypothetical protein